MIDDKKMYEVTLRVVIGDQQTKDEIETCNGKRLKQHQEYADVVNYNEVSAPIESLINHVIALFCNAGTQVYVIKNADDLEQAMRSAMSDYRTRFSLYHLAEDGIGKMNDTCVCTPPGCHVIDMEDF